MLQLAPKKVGNNEGGAERRVEHTALYDYIKFPECRRLVNRINTEQRERNFKSLTVLNKNSDRGKTVFTSVIALGYLMFLDKRVLIIDTVSDSRDGSFYYREFYPHSSKAGDGNAKRAGCIDLITAESLSRKNLLHYSGGALIHSEAAEPFDGRGDDGAEFQINPFIDSIKRYYDLILIDTCAFDEANRDSFDPMIIAEHSDCSVLILPESSLERDSLVAIGKELKRHHLTPLGVVLNRELQ